MTTRVGYAVGFLICAGLLGFAFYLQYYEQQDPCPLCILQRVAFIAMMAVFLVGALHGPSRRGAFIYSALLVVIGIMGTAVAGRQVWLQHLPANEVPACGPGLSYMLEQFPLGDALRKIFAGSGECAEAGWRFLGLTIAGWSLVWLLVLTVFALLIALRAPRMRGRPA